ncbi:iron ABC transporter permease [uncultured Tistrella sp.]|uniref:FecCD family ABC transporter permease n=1 Tax=Tistrella mobilis TaxID=171437 RepID=UPI000C0ABD83|nr:iron ABC transporter permease [uncultured Tistrella sp.]MAM75345.1 ABC transporter permease [Tistrella sp.]
MTVRRAFCALIALLLVAILAGLWLGTEPARIADLAALLRGEDSPFTRLLLAWRLPRVLAAVAVGACLGLAGAIFQGVFRNPLAEPWLLGTAPGAAVGAAIALLVPLPVAPGLALPVLAIAGAWGATWVVIAAARAAGIADVTGVLLAGVAVAAALGAVRGLMLLALSDDTVNLQVVMSWTMGGIHTPDMAGLGLLWLATLAALALALVLAPGLDRLGLGDEAAGAMGLNVRRFTELAVLAGAAITAIAVGWGGLVGFVGLMVPHLARRLVGPAHHLLLPASALAGGALVAIFDGLARSLLPPADLPLGLLTALAGAPVFLLLLGRARGGVR